MFRKIILIIVAGILIMIGCKKKKVEEPDPFDSFDKKSMLNNIGSNIIIPSYFDLKSNCEGLATACLSFTNNPDSNNLVNARTSWKKAAEAWKLVELFRLGPGDEDFIYTQIDNFTYNASGIESNISQGTTINSAYVESKGSPTKGIPALEYLLFSSSAPDSILIKRFTETGDYLKRKEYLNALCENLKSKASSLYNSWNGGYLNTFVNADGRDVGSSLSLLVNQMAILTEEIKNIKIGIPLGKNSSGTAQPQAVEAYLSKNSINHIRKNLKSLEDLFIGNLASGDGSGIDDLLDALKAKYNGQALSYAIKETFTNINVKTDAISSTLDIAVSQYAAQVEALYSAIKELLVLLKVEMANSLGILLTFSDNDGD